MNDTELRAAIPALASGGAAIITGAASGIGLAAAHRFAALGLPIVMVDANEAALEQAAEAVFAGKSARTVNSVRADVADVGDMQRLQEHVSKSFSNIAVLMNNAAIGANPGMTWLNGEAWKRLLDINLGGVINGVMAFAPLMLAQSKPGLIINTGSKQGVTLPPGNAAYNVSKAAVRAYTESLAHELREAGAPVSAHLLIPGFTFTGMTAGARTEKPAAAWTAEQVIDFMLESISRGEFYILCPDNDVARSTDEKRMQWTADDIIKNRPALSRWHPDYKAAFDAFMKG